MNAVVLRKVWLRWMRDGSTKKKKIVVEKNDEIIFERGEGSDVTDPFFISVHNPSVISRLAVIQKKIRKKTDFILH
jgi:hypothetical protein